MNFMGLTNCQIISTVTKDEDPQHWLSVRNSGIGGSDIGAICGVSPFTSARQVYLAKTGQYNDSMQPSGASQERMHWGNLLEPVIADEYQRRTGIKLVCANATLQHKDYPWARANVDRLMVDENGKVVGILEVKSTSEYNDEEWSEGEILLSYVYQLNWYFWVLGLDKGAFACLVGGNKFYSYEVFRNDDLIENTLIPAAKKFWYENVLALKEPEMQSADTDFANATYKSVVKDSEIALEDDVANELAKTIFECKGKIKELTKIMEEAQNRIKDRLKDVEIGYTRDYVIKWSPRSQMRVDTDKLKHMYPDCYNAVLKKIEFRAMYVKGA
jgi:putative phage-type endonuclease